MENVRLIYEQIEHAKNMLLSGSLLNARLALILLDNAAEVMMYRELTRQFAWDDQLGKWQQDRPPELRPKYTLKQREKTEKEFGPMITVLQQLGRLSEEQASVLRVGHEFRVEAFHRAQLNPAVLRPSTILLYQTVVQLPVQFHPPIFGIPGGGPKGEDAIFLSRFRIERAEDLADPGKLPKLRDFLLESVSLDISEFAGILSEDLQERIEGVIGGIGHVSDLTTDAQIDQRLQEIQFWEECGAVVAKDAHDRGEAPIHALEKARAEWQENPGPKYTVPKLREWQRIAAAIAHNKNAAKALLRYSEIQKQFIDLEDKVLQGVAEFDWQYG